MRERKDIFGDIRKDFESRAKRDLRSSPALTFYTDAVSGALERVYQEIHDVKSPYIFTEVDGEDLDGIGFLVNCPREVGEGDESYMNRLMNWTLKNQASNKTAIEDALLNLEYSSDAKYVEHTHGCGTGSIFIIPKDYEQKEKAEQEVKNKISDVISPGKYIDYIFPTPKSVKIMAYLHNEEGDKEFIKSQLESEFEKYINELAPVDNLEIGELNRIGYDKSPVSYFSILEIKIDQEPVRELSISQDIKTKFIYDSTIWVVE